MTKNSAFRNRACRGAGNLVIGLVVVIAVLVTGIIVAAQVVISDTVEELAVLGHEETIAEIGRVRDAIQTAVEAEEALYVPSDQLLVSIGETPRKAPGVLSGAPAMVKAADLGLRITGVSWHPARPLVFLNNDVYTVGDVVAGVTIDSISQSTITVSDSQGTQRTFSLYD